MKRDVANVLKCTLEESRQQVVAVLHGCCEEGKGSSCFSGGPIKDIVGSCCHRALEMGDWGSRHLLQCDVIACLRYPGPFPGANHLSFPPTLTPAECCLSILAFQTGVK